MHSNILPKWLIETLINGTSVWDKATVTSFSHLLQKITLHDSVWLYTFIPEEGGLVLVIQLDSHWNKDFCHQLDDWPYLIIEVNMHINTSYGFTDDMVNIISESYSTSIDSTIFSEWIKKGNDLGLISREYSHQLKDAEIYRTDIITLSGYFSCIHAGNIGVLLYSDSGELLPVDLSRTNTKANYPLPKQKEPGILSRLFHWNK